MSTIEPYTTDIQHFIDAFWKGMNGLVEAAAILVKLIEANAGAKDQIIESDNRFDRSLLNRLEAVGRGSLSPQLVLETSSGAVALRRLPLSDQQQVLKEGIPLLMKRNGSFETLIVSFQALTADQVRQAFHKDHVRTDGEQRAWIESHMATRSLTVKQLYRVGRDKVRVFEPCELSRRDLLNILGQMG